MKSFPVSAWIVVALGILPLLCGCKKEVMASPPASRPAKFFTVVAAEEQSVRRYPAVVEANEKTTVSFKVPGRITSIYVKQGQEVKSGELIAAIDDRDYELAANRAKSQLEATQAQERAMKAGVRPEDIRILENNLSAAKSQFERDEQFFLQRQGLVESGAISREELQSAEAAYRMSKANLESAKKELEKGKVGARKEEIEAVEARVRDLKENVRDAENALQDTKLYAPFTARVIDKLVEPHEEVSARQPIAYLQKMDVIKLNFSLPESVVFNLERSNVGTFSAVFNELPGKEIPVNLNEFRLEADAKTRTFTCWVVMPTLQGVIILPGMTAEVIHRNPRGADRGLPVPSSAVAGDPENRPFVWKISPADMTVHKVPVTTGAMAEDKVWITQGLEPGDIIVGAGANFLVEGMKVHGLESKE